MANHGNIPLKEKITVDDLKKVVIGIMKDKFGDYLSLTVDDECFWLTLKNPKVGMGGYDVMAKFWINETFSLIPDNYLDEDDYSKEDYKKDKEFVKDFISDIEFRHGHGDLGWWVETVLQKELIKYYGVEDVYDGGVGWFKTSEMEEYSTFRDYKTRMWAGIGGKKGLSWSARRAVNRQVKEATEISDLFSDNWTR